jgi:N utilization substance protein A
MVVNELKGEKIDIVPFSDDPADFVMKALSPARVKEVRIHEDTGTAEVIVPDYQLSLAIGKEGQNARLAARLTGWRVDIKSETQLVEEEAYGQQEWAEGEWVVNPDTGEQVWQPAEGGPAVSAEEWEAALAEAPTGNGEPATGDAGAGESAEPADAPSDAQAPPADDAKEPADEAMNDASDVTAGEAPDAEAVEVPAEGGTEPRADEE